MEHHPITAARSACEDILLEEKRYNIEHGILASENEVVDRLLARGPELIEAYHELHSKLSSQHGSLRAFMQLVLYCSAHWSEPKLFRERQARRELIELNASIASEADRLANLLEKRSYVREHSAFRDDTIYHPIDLIICAAAQNHRFERWVAKPLSAVGDQFDLKYWPGLDDLLRALSRDAANSSIEATDPLTAAATASPRGSLADVFRALFAAIEEQKSGYRPALPKDFRPTDSTLASLASCALDLGPDELVSGEYVKRLRQRDRTTGKA